jgi:hypothetical protein
VSRAVAKKLEFHATISPRKREQVERDLVTGCNVLTNAR